MGLLGLLRREQTGCIAFSPPAQRLLIDNNFNGVPTNSRVATKGVLLKRSDLCHSNIKEAEQLNHLAINRGEKLAQMTLSWLLKDSRLTSVLIGASNTQQMDYAVQALHNIVFADHGLVKINLILDF